MPAAADAPLHASCVAVGGKAVLVTGPSGSGKSALCLSLMALGAVLVADDRVILNVRDNGLWASAPPPLRGMIEARGVGLLTAECLAEARLALAVDLALPEPDRLPQDHSVTYLGTKLPLLHTPANPHFAAAILQVLKGGRRTP